MYEVDWSRRTVMLASAGTLVVTGCLGDDQTDDDPADDGDSDDITPEEPSDDETDEAEIAVDHIETARSEIQAAFDELELRHEDAFDNETFQSYLTAAESELYAAMEYATSEQGEEIEALHGALGYLGPWGDAEHDANLGFETMDPGERAYWAGRDYFFFDDPEPDDFAVSTGEFADAVEAFEKSQSHFESAAILFEEAREALEELDPAVLEPFDHADRAEHVEHHEFAQYLSANMNFYALGHASGSGGWETTAAALELVLLEEWEAARTTFEEAQERFADASSAYLIVDFQFLNDVAPFLHDVFGVLMCEIESGVEMTDHFITSMDAAIDGEQSEHEAEMDGAFEVPIECH